MRSGSTDQLFSDYPCNEIKAKYISSSPDLANKKITTKDTGNVS